MKEIESIQHPIVKHLVKLREKRDYRAQCHSALISGKKLIKELSVDHRFKTVLIEKDHVSDWGIYRDNLKNREFEKPSCQIPDSSGCFGINAQQVFVVNSSIMKKVTGLIQPEPIAAEIDLPQEQDLSTKQYLLILDGISDPGNMGTLLRTALALGWQGVLITPGSTDPFNEKAIRAAKGATFKIPLRQASLEEIEALLASTHHTILAADAQGTPMNELTISGPIALALGNEANGLSDSIKRKALPIAIPMEKEMESLNVASAGAILMNFLKRSR